MDDGARIGRSLRSRIAGGKRTGAAYHAVFERIAGYAAEPVRRLGFDRLPPRLAVTLLYQMYLRRPPDPVGGGQYVFELEARSLANRDLMELLRGSTEGQALPSYSGRNWFVSLHESRIRWVRMLPRAARIVDLGGDSIADARGAFVSYRYPYRFDSLVVVDLPSQERHAFYRSDQHQSVETDLGPVSFRYHSMVDLSSFADSSADLVFCGQSIEHVTLEEGVVLAKEVFRILAPGGSFVVDTPNARITRLQQDEFIDPDHKHEYTWVELSRLLEGTGFVIEMAKGLNYAGAAASSGRFDIDEVAANCGIFDEIEDCYLLAVVARKPVG